MIVTVSSVVVVSLGDGVGVTNLRKAWRPHPFCRRGLIQTIRELSLFCYYG